jgi:acyl-CoA thioesterase FadM
MVNVETQDIHAAQSVTEVFFDPNTRSAVQIPEDLKKVILKSTS